MGIMQPYIFYDKLFVYRFLTSLQSVIVSCNSIKNGLIFFNCVYVYMLVTFYIKKETLIN